VTAAAMKLAAVMVTCPEREPLRRQTLRNLAATDWEGEVDLAVDGGTGPDRIARIDAAWRDALGRAAAADADLVLVLEDDLDFNRHLRENLIGWQRLRGVGRTQPFFASLYNPGHPPMHTWIESRCHIMDPNACWGAQAFLLSPVMAQYLLARWPEVGGEPDIRMPRLAGRAVPVYYHRPSLVEHIGDVSTWGGRHHRAVDFDRHWRAFTSPAH
jgi:hypothetical protein